MLHTATDIHFVMAGHSASEDARERAYVRPSTSLPHQQRKTWMPPELGLARVPQH
jgi:hypothetical protein